MAQPQFILDRRGMLRAGAAGVAGFTLPAGSVSRGADLLSSMERAEDVRASGVTPRARSVLMVLLSGGPAQLDTFDPKPEAPAEIRGEFSAIQSAISGISVCEHLPQLAARMNQWAIVRSMAHREHNHLLATHVALTGRATPVPRGGSDLDRVESRNDFPNLAAALSYVQPRRDGIPTGVSLPNYLIEGPLTWPGQHAGFLGPRHDPWQINHDPNDSGFRVESLSVPEDTSDRRILSRRDLLNRLNGDRAVFAGDGRSGAFAEQQDVAFSLLTSARVAEAFRIDREQSATRDRYGRNKFGQSLLLSRRLIEAGVPVVQAAMGIVQTWDTHVDNWGRLKRQLLPWLDQGLAALIDDLSAAGRLDETLVVVMGEFGRTPRISTLPGQTVPGRDHWAHVYSMLFSGAGVRGGQVIGESDSIAAYPRTRAWSPADVGTTILHALGVSQKSSVTDPLGRPAQLLNGEIILPLYRGGSV